MHTPPAPQEPPARPSASDAGGRRDPRARVPRARDPRPPQTLEAGAVRLPGVLMQAVTHIAPAVGVIFAVQAIAAAAGPVVPLAFAAGGLAMATVAVSVVQLSRKLPSAGGYFTWITEALGPRTGFTTAWLYLLYEPLGGGSNIAFAGGVLHSAGLPVPWWVTAAAGTLLLLAVGWYGLKLSVTFIVAMGIFEVAVCLALAVTGLLHPGPGGISALPFDPAHAADGQGLALGTALAVFAFGGFEQAAPLAEETRHPTRTLPRAVTLSLLLAGLFFLFASWGVLTGWGTGRLGGFVSAGSPVFGLARRVWGGAWVLLLIAFANSALGAALAVQNASTRVLYGMARAGALPRRLATVHPRRRTPVAALLVQAAVTAVITFGGGALLGPTGVLEFAAIVITLLITVVYVAGNAAVGRLYSRRYPSEYRRLVHLVVPGLSTLILLYVDYRTVLPLPGGPERWAPVAAGAWLLAGLTVVTLLSRTRHRSWTAQATGAVSAAPAEGAAGDGRGLPG